MVVFAGWARLGLRLGLLGLKLFLMTTDCEVIQNAMICLPSVKMNNNNSNPNQFDSLSQTLLDYLVVRLYPLLLADDRLRSAFTRFGGAPDGALKIVTI